MRMHGDDAGVRAFVALEPVITVLGLFPVTYFLLQKRASTFASLVGGTLLSRFARSPWKYKRVYKQRRPL